MLIETKEQDGVRLDAVVFAGENGEMSKRAINCKLGTSLPPFDVNENGFATPRLPCHPITMQGIVSNMPHSAI